MPNAIIYTRVSSDEQVKGTSLEYQEQICRQYCSTKGIEVLNVFREEGVSAKTAERLELLRAMEYCRRHKGQRLSPRSARSCGQPDRDSRSPSHVDARRTAHRRSAGGGGTPLTGRYPGTCRGLRHRDDSGCEPESPDRGRTRRGCLSGGSRTIPPSLPTLSGKHRPLPLGHDLDDYSRQLDVKVFDLLAGQLSYLVLDLERGAVYYHSLGTRIYLVAVTLDQDRVSHAESKVRALAERLAGR